MCFAKSRVAPLAPQTIPRLELQAVVLASRLAKIVENGHSLKLSRRIFWSDSKVTLFRINSQKKHAVFEANRIKEIRSLTRKKEWRWVPTKDNVADDAKREKALLFSECRWFKGPEFLKLEESAWPSCENFDTYDPEEITLVINEKPDVKFERFSQYRRLIRAVAWALRFKFNLMNKENRRTTSYLNLEELHAAEMLCIKLAQEESFHEEVSALQKEKLISKSSKLYPLSVILLDGILRIK